MKNEELKQRLMKTPPPKLDELVYGDVKPKSLGLMGLLVPTLSLMLVVGIFYQSMKPSALPEFASVDEELVEYADVFLELDPADITLEEWDLLLADNG